MSEARNGSRLASLDQFRGYIVAGMLLANFAGLFDFGKKFLGHGDGFFAWADSIMPGFLFCAGFSFRLTARRRFPQLGAAVASLGYARRSLVLVGLSLLIFAVNVAAGGWRGMVGKPASEILFELIKADLWEVLSIIGVGQLLLLPVIHRGARTRLATAAGFFFGYILLNGLFAYNFQEGLDNWLNQYFGAHRRRSWDGGLFGVMAWVVPMAAGSLACDVLTGRPATRVVSTFLRAGVALMCAGYALSCLSTLYDRPPEPAPPGAAPARHAADPVWPRPERWRSPGLRLAEPPFTPAAPVAERQLNFWMMSKRIVSPSFTLFALGFNFVLFAGFIRVCDVKGRQSGLFRLFGQNPLAAYLLHLAILQALHAALRGASLTFPMTIALLAVYFALCWSVVRFMEKRGLYLRL